MKGRVEPLRVWKVRHGFRRIYWKMNLLNQGFVNNFWSIKQMHLKCLISTKSYSRVFFFGLFVYFLGDFINFIFPLFYWAVISAIIFFNSKSSFLKTALCSCFMDIWFSLLSSFPYASIFWVRHFVCFSFSLSETFLSYIYPCWFFILKREACKS